MKSISITGLVFVILLKYECFMQQWSLDTFEIEVRKKCLKDIGINVNNLQDQNSSSSSSSSRSSGNLTDPTPQYKCYLSCFLNGISFIRNNTLQDEVVIGILQQRRFDVDELRKALELCKNKNIDNVVKSSDSIQNCDIAYSAIKCLKDNIPNGYSKILL